MREISCTRDTGADVTYTANTVNQGATSAGCQLHGAPAVGLPESCNIIIIICGEQPRVSLLCTEVY